MGIDELRAEALKLNPQSRAMLARELLASLEALTDAEIEQLWVDEGIRRDKELEEGSVLAIPVSEVMARARARR